MLGLLVGYDGVSGKILSQVFGDISTEQEYTLQNLGMQTVLIEDESGLLDIYSTYILNGQPTERPASPVTRTDLTLHDVPNEATLWINGVSYPAEGDVELQFTLPGIYSLRVECFPYLDWTDEVVIP